MRPPIPLELLEQNKELPAEGQMFVGDKGKILTDFYVGNPILLGKETTTSHPNARVDQVARSGAALQNFVTAVKTGNQYPGNFREAEGITEAINLYAVALRSGKMLKYDATARTITNVPEANAYLNRTYRSGFDPFA